MDAEGGRLKSFKQLDFFFEKNIWEQIVFFFSLRLKCFSVHSLNLAAAAALFSRTVVKMKWSLMKSFVSPSPPPPSLPSISHRFAGASSQFDRSIIKARFQSNDLPHHSFVSFFRFTHTTYTHTHLIEIFQQLYFQHKKTCAKATVAQLRATSTGSTRAKMRCIFEIFEKKKSPAVFLSARKCVNFCPPFFFFFFFRWKLPSCDGTHSIERLPVSCRQVR